MEKEEVILQEIFETKLPLSFANEERLLVIDTFSQFSQNPTSKSAGYGIEENYLFIGENLKKRYKIAKTTIENILTFLKESFEKMREVNYDVYFWRDAIADYIKKKYTNVFLRWYDSLYEELNEEEKTVSLLTICLV